MIVIPEAELMLASAWLPTHLGKDPLLDGFGRLHPRDIHKRELLVIRRDLQSNHILHRPRPHPSQHRRSEVYQTPAAVASIRRTQSVIRTVSLSPLWVFRVGSTGAGSRI